MRKAILLFFFLMAILVLAETILAVNEDLSEKAGSEQLAYSLLVHFNVGEFNLETIKLIESGSMPAEKGNDYTAQVVSFSGNVLFETTFNAKLRVFDADTDFLTERSIDLLLPYYPNVKSIVLSKGRQQLLEIDVAKYALCNENAKCDGNETVKFCSEDCLTQAQSASSHVQAAKTPDERRANFAIYGLLSGLLLLVLVSICFGIKRFRQPEKEQKGKH